MFKEKPKNEKVILIEKKVISDTKKPNEALKLHRMKYGIYDNLNGEKNKKVIEYYLIFMTNKGRKTFLVDPKIYHQIKLDSLGILERQGDKLVSFSFEKKATKSDVEILGW